MRAALWVLIQYSHLKVEITEVDLKGDDCEVRTVLNYFSCYIFGKNILSHK